MERLDPVMQKLVEELKDDCLAAAERSALEQKLKRREEQLAGVYHQVGTGSDLAGC
jgi:hypothetical protein